jgi:[ribosomal protein S5]-alanine N-acetyltransferase
MAGLRGLIAGMPSLAGGAPGSTLPHLETERLSVRLARPGMERALATFLAENFEGHLDRWSPPVGRGFFTEAFWREKLKLAAEEFHSDRAVRFAMQLREGGKGPSLDAPIIGTCNYTNVIRGPFQACNLGYQIAQAHEGKGLMREALAAANAYMFTERRLHRIMANYRPENHRSAGLLQRLGFVREGMAADYLFIEGAWRDHILTALTNPDFDPAWIDSAGR